MIKPEDLRIGDLVMISHGCMFPKGTMCAVTEIHPDKEFGYKKGVVSLSAINDNDDRSCGTWLCNVDGIPITPEILRNNDFKEDVDGKYFTRPIKARAGSSLARYLAIERKKYAWAIFIKYYNVKGYALLCHIKYVHELQHILLVLGFDAGLKIK